MLIKIIDNTYLGKTAGVKVTAKPVDGVGCHILGKDLIDVGVDLSINPEYKYFLSNHEVKVIQS